MGLPLLMSARNGSGRAAVLALTALAFALTLAIRVRGIESRFWLQGDQIRDWSIALRSFTDLPLVGPATHVQGYTVGPAFYWILWSIRVIVGPWFQNLPHAGGIGQAVLESGVDTLLLIAVWRRTGSLPVAVSTIVLLATAPFALALSAVIWNPVVGATLAKAAVALVLLDFHRGSSLGLALTAAVGWIAVHAYTGAVFVAVSVFAALVLDAFVREDLRTALRSAATIFAVVVLLQTPYIAHQIATGFSDSGMGAVGNSIARILSGRDRLRLAESEAGYSLALNQILVTPWTFAGVGWAMVTASAVVLFRFRHDPPLLMMTVVPQAAAVAGYAFFLAGLDSYYYLPLMPSAVLTLVLAATAVVPVRLSRAAGVLILAGALAIVPARLRTAATMFSMREYAALLSGSRTLAQRGQPVRAVETEFQLPATSDSEFLYRILGGRFDARSPWIAVITSTGNVTYRNGGP